MVPGLSGFIVLCRGGVGASEGRVDLEAEAKAVRGGDPEGWARVQGGLGSGIRSGQASASGSVCTMGWFGLAFGVRVKARST